MARNQNTKKAEQVAPITWDVSNVRQWKYGAIQFALDLELAKDRTVTIYGCRIAAGKEKGRNFVSFPSRNFVSFPSRKGTDGKYYSHAYVRLTDEEQQEIIAAVMDELDNE